MSATAKKQNQEVPAPLKSVQPKKDKLRVRIVDMEVVHFLVKIHWAQSEIVAILDDALRKDSLSIAKLPEQGTGLAQALKVTNWAMEKVIKQLCAGEPCLDDLYGDDEETKAAIDKIRDEAALKVDRILNPSLTDLTGSAA
jgi:hypothetical protein